MTTPRTLERLTEYVLNGLLTTAEAQTAYPDVDIAELSARVARSRAALGVPAEPQGA